MTDVSTPSVSSDEANPEEYPEQDQEAAIGFMTIMTGAWMGLCCSWRIVVLEVSIEVLPTPWYRLHLFLLALGSLMVIYWGRRWTDSREQRSGLSGLLTYLGMPVALISLWYAASWPAVVTGIIIMAVMPVAFWLHRRSRLRREHASRATA